MNNDNNINQINQLKETVEYIINQNNELNLINNINLINQLKETVDKIVVRNKELNYIICELKEKIRSQEIEIHYIKSTLPKNNNQYDYMEIKKHNKILHNEFKRIYKLIRK
jgi:transcriptional regulator NrdR family protein